MRIVSWNVNGVRAALGKGLRDSIARAAPDVLCLQETRALPHQAAVGMEGYLEFWNPAQKPGYSGVAVMTRAEPLDVRLGGVLSGLDDEGRTLALEFPDFFVVSVYTPNAQRGLLRLQDRMRWDAAFLAYLQRLEREKPVIACGDFNVAHREIDLANPRQNVNNAGFTPQERAGFDALIRAGFVDTFREFEPGGGHYTWWTWRVDARARNIGWRIDYALVSASLRPRLTSASILNDIHGSDHCPVDLVLS
ncbi:MAG: exodeoxyribonuclease III [Candidatus Latescibacteria bacterium]|nr:exodeoxyribonuclease III [Candidatus Latescibacterota bacterium]